VYYKHEWDYVAPCPLTIFASPDIISVSFSVEFYPFVSVILGNMNDVVIDVTLRVVLICFRY
jgi:hypothetical protein